jgi:hypothetical protein
MSRTGDRKSERLVSPAEQGERIASACERERVTLQVR